LLRTIPGIGEILAPLVWLEIGEIERFPRAENLASYAGLVPRIMASGGRIRHGGTCRNVNHYLKWGFVEAATCAMRLTAYRGTHIERLYRRLAPSKLPASPCAEPSSTERFSPRKHRVPQGTLVSPNSLMRRK
jgi:transposase